MHVNPYEPATCFIETHSSYLGSARVVDGAGFIEFVGQASFLFRWQGNLLPKRTPNSEAVIKVKNSTSNVNSGTTVTIPSASSWGIGEALLL